MRLIDADALSEKLCKTTVFIKDGEVFQRMINDAPTVSAEAVQRWIPVSEMLPERNRSVLVYESIYENIYTAYYDSAYGWMTFDPCWNGCFPEYLNIIAWMPLPEPYKGGDDE